MRVGNADVRFLHFGGLSSNSGWVADHGPRSGRDALQISIGDKEHSLHTLARSVHLTSVNRNARIDTYVRESSDPKRARS
jgi:hypothetical protein